MNKENIKEILRALEPFKDRIAFKGGTSLFFMYDSMNRVSVDLDLMHLKSEKNIQQEIRDELLRKGFELEDAEPGEYGVLFNVRKSEWDQNEYIAIDISTYRLDKVRTVSGSEFNIDRMREEAYFEGIKCFNHNITFFEKILAGSRVLQNWKSGEIHDSTKRKLRHLEDVARLHKNKKVDFTKRFMKYAILNEINIKSFLNIGHWGDLDIFKIELLENVRADYEKWNDQYEKNDSKLPFDDVIQLLEEIHEKIKDIEFISEDKKV